MTPTHAPAAPIPTLGEIRAAGELLDDIVLRTATERMELETTIELRSPNDLAEILSEIRATGLPCDIAPIDRYGSGV